MYDSLTKIYGDNLIEPVRERVLWSIVIRTDISDQGTLQVLTTTSTTPEYFEHIKPDIKYPGSLMRSTKI